LRQGKGAYGNVDGSFLAYRETDEPTDAQGDAGKSAIAYGNTNERNVVHESTV
jgi:hypothetical protein